MILTSLPASGRQSGQRSLPAWLLLIACTLLLSGCPLGSDSSSGSNASEQSTQVSRGGPPQFSEGRVFTIEPGPEATRDMVDAMIQLRPGDVLEFTCGFFQLDHGLLIQATEDVTIRGCGRDGTVLSFLNSTNVSGLEALNVRGITVQDLTIADSPGDAFKLKGVKWGTLLNVRAYWSGGDAPLTADDYQDRIHVACTEPPFNEGDSSPDYTVSSASGRYGIYPVESENILVDGAESVGASDAGIYVGQTNNAIIRNSRAVYNVMGFEIENVQGGEYDSNLAECNTGGFLIYDLDNLTQYGDKSVMLNNIARNNNTYNFAHSGIVSAVPRGVGFLTLGYDNIEIYDNLFEDHSTAAVIYTSYELLNGKDGTADKKLSPYTEGLHIHNNVMINSGYDLPRPDIEQVVEGQIETLLPTLIGIKHVQNPGQGAHIIWDGLLDELDADCPYPVDSQGSPVPARDNGRPEFTNEHPNPSCHYNAYKFDEQGERKLPEWGSCFRDNHLDDDSPAYMNFHGTQGLELVIAAAEQDTSILSVEGIESVVDGLDGLVASTDPSEHDCQARFGRVLDPLPRVTIPPFERSGETDPAPSAKRIEQLCRNTGRPGGVNRDALEEVNCPRLDQYNLFADPQDPRSTPNEGGVPFVLNSKLFSDYSNKYRVAFVPPGTKAIYQDGQGGSNLNGTIHFPNGTVIAKTFAFTDEQAGTEELVETRLLIKRAGASGKAFWDGVTYEWVKDENGEPVTQLAQGGGTRSVSWHYRDSDSGRLLTGATDSYEIPNALQCLTCHSNDDVESGSAPIGPKPRNLNRAYAPESSFMGVEGQGGFPRINQLRYWEEQGILTNVPELNIDQAGVATNVPRLPHWNVPGDSGATEGSGEDVEARVRAYLEVNCQHCHNDRGSASNTGYYLDHFREVNASYGVCKTPTATGGGACGRQHVVVPGDPDASIVTCRVESADNPQRRMPPIAHNVVHAEGAELLAHWIREVVDSDYENGDNCGNRSFLPSTGSLFE